MSMFRAYFYDLTTRKELKDFGLNGREWVATGSMVKDQSGNFVPDTTDMVEVKVGRTFKTITAKDFPGKKIAVKIWFGPEAPAEWRKLV